MLAVEAAFAGAAYCLQTIWTNEARRVANLPADWHAWKFAAVGRGVSTGKGGNGKLRVTGAVCPLITRGPRKGQPNVRKAGRRTSVIIDLTKLQADA